MTRIGNDSSNSKPGAQESDTGRQYEQEMFNQSLAGMGAFSAEALQSIYTQCKTRQLCKQETLLEAGQICQSAYFIVSGAFYQFRMRDIDENIIELHIENEWFLNQASFIAQKPSIDTIKAYADSKILELTVSSIHQLIESSPVFFQLGKLLHPTTQRTQFFDEAMTPAEKYNYLLTHRPLLFQRFPLKYIAAYLKTTPETLSRIRSTY